MLTSNKRITPTQAAERRTNMSSNKFTVKEYLSQGLLYFVEIYSALWLTVLIGSFSVFIYRFFSNFDSLEEAIFSTIVMSIVMFITLYSYAFRRGDKNRELNLKTIFISLPIAFVIQLIYANVFSFAIYTAGPAYYAGSAICISGGGTDKGVPAPFVFWCMLPYYVAYLGIYILGEYRGAKRRNQESKDMLSKSNK